MHSSLRALGYVVGGPQAVVEALLAVLGPTGTLVVPTHTPENTDPAGWSNPPVPQAWWQTIRTETPGFDRERTPAARPMGRLAELVRTWPGAVRSVHPQVSFAAVGARAAEVTSRHRLDDALGDSSPLGEIYRLDGRVLLLGCGHGSNTSMHLAEWRWAESPREQIAGSILQPDGSSEWTEWSDVVADADDFDRIGAAFEAAQPESVRIGTVAGATARVMSQRAVVDFAGDWMSRHRVSPGEESASR